MPDGHPKTVVGLSGVPETMLWPLWNRAVETGRRNRILADPMAADLVARIDYDFRRSFGPPSVFHAIRARVGDDLIRAYLQRTEDAGAPAAVVGLGEGLDTQLWRVDDGRVQWISVDLADAIGVRQRLLPTHPRATAVASSALDPAWMEAVPDRAAPFVSAGGLFMYFEGGQVADLLTRIADRFPGAEVFFDTITPFLSEKSRRGWAVTKHYTAPLMPWGILMEDLPAFLAAIPSLQTVSIQSYTEVFPARTWPFGLLSRLAFLRRRYRCCLVHGRVAPGSEAAARP